MSYTTFQIVYDGPALENSTMDVRDLAPALLALGDTIEEANYALNQHKAKVAVKVKASFKTGCFGIELDVVQSVLNQTLSLFQDSGISSANELVELMGFTLSPLGGLIGFLRWLKGRKVNEIILAENGNVKVVCDKDSITVERATIELYRHYKLRQALEKVIAEPLRKDGIDSVAFKVDANPAFLTIEKTERDWFGAPMEEDEILGDQTEIANLQLVTVAFRGENKWRVSEGQNTFFATVSDEDFLRKVDHAEESFTSGDILRVKLNKRQWLSNGTMKAEYQIIEVLEHRKAATQMKIPFKDQS